MFHHYWFTRKMNIITDHKLLVTIFKKEVATLSQRLQWILLRIHQYRVRIIYKPVLDLFIAVLMSRNKHEKNKDAEIPGLQLNIDAIQSTTDFPNCMTMQKLQQSQNNIQTWTRSVHSSMDVQKKTWEKQRCRNTWPAIKYRCHTINYRFPKLHDNVETTTESE